MYLPKELGEIGEYADADIHCCLIFQPYTRENDA